MPEFTVDFVAQGLSDGGWGLVLVEEGPWRDEDVLGNLGRIQDQLYNCLDAILDGQLADKYPGSRGKPVLIRIDAYQIGDEQIRPFFESFSSQVLEVPDYKNALAVSSDVPAIRFELNMCTNEG